MSAQFPPCPASLKQIQHFLKVAQEHDGRDIVVSYWSRLYALQVGLKLSTHQPDETKLLLGLMDWLETIKKDHHENDAIVNEIAAQAHLENYALKLFLYADKQDREANFGKNVVKAFYTSGIIYDVLQTFGDLTDEATQNRKYAKWKAAYIHNCLKNGETPVPGPMTEDDDDGAVGGEGMDTSETNNTPLVDVPQLPPQPQSFTPPAQAPTVEEVLSNPSKLPSPPPEEENTGFVPFVPQAQPEMQPFVAPAAANLQLTPEQMLKAQKYCKYAGSALTFDDVKSAIENLQNALRLLTTGKDG